ncbi:MAG: hypothetical protein JEY94_00035 [Melioribacteraceae bacterium]|nr:hypothetical protein [Melioribacteraceae bacterium]
MKTRINVLLIVVFIFNLFCGCEESTGVDDKNYDSTLIAHAGSDQTCNAGSFVYLDISQSSFPKNKSLIFDWKQDEDNPEEIALFSNHQFINPRAVFYKAGVYKFYLQLKIDTLKTNHEIKYGNIDDVTVTVEPRNIGIIKDIILESDIRMAINEPTEELNSTLLESVDSLLLGHYSLNRIQSLSGIEYCKNLKFLNASLQRISDLTPLSELHILEWLNLSQNWTFRNIEPLANLINLKYLDLDGNYVPYIGYLENLDRLEYLNIMYNEKITNISCISDMKNLKELWISNSEVGNLDEVKSLTELTTLWAAKCGMEDVFAIKNLTELKILFLKYNNISDISELKNLIKLERLYLDDNNITDISVLEKMVNVNKFTLDNNNIEDILPLVNNKGFNGTGHMVSLTGNPLNEKSKTEYIQNLRARGVIVIY